MKALYYPAYDELVLTDLLEPDIAPDEVLVKVSACGICGSELETFKTKSARRIPPLTMGHEFCGVIEKLGAEVSQWEVGTHVVSNSIVSCGQCEQCVAGKTNLCIHRQVFGMHRNGAFGAYVNVPSTSLILMPPYTDPLHACLTEPLANGVHLVNLTKSADIKNVLIMGAGPIGLATQQAFKAMRNVNIIITDIRNERLDIAKRIGANEVINPLEKNLEIEIPRILNGEQVDLVIDAVGSPQTNKAGLDIVKSGGTMLIIGLHNNSKSLYSYDIVLAEKTVMGSYAATQRDMIEALSLISDRKVDMSSWVSYYPFERGKEAFFDMMEAKGSHIKSVIVF